MVKFVFWDVQHGSAAYIQTPNQTGIVVDLGTGSYGSSSKEFSPLLHLKNNWRVSELDAVIITHPHRDHLDDIFNLDELSPRVLQRPKHLNENDIRSGNRTNDNQIIDKFLEINNRYNSPVSNGTSPFDSNNNGGVVFNSFVPKGCATSNLNNHSIVTIVSYAQSKMLIPGDNEPASWKELLDNTAFQNAIRNTDIFLAPHHGRDSGFCEELFEYIKPKLTIISDGRFCDTSAVDRYRRKTIGWVVHRRGNGEKVERKCLTTRNDGVIIVNFGINNDQRPFIEVTIN